MSNLDVIKALYESIANKDWHRFAELSDPGLEWIQNEGFPKGKRRLPRCSAGPARAIWSASCSAFSRSAFSCPGDAFGRVKPLIS